MNITITLSPGSLRGLTPSLAELGHLVRERPLLHFVPPDDWAPLDNALANIGRYRAIGLSSPRAATALRDRWINGNGITGALPEIWAAGQSTAARLLGFSHAHAPKRESGASALADLMLAAVVDGPVLYLCGEERRDELPERLRSAGRTVDEVVCYRAELASPNDIVAALEGTDLILIGSHRLITIAVQLELAGPRPGLICLGRATAQTARLVGWEPVAVAESPTMDAVVEAVSRVALEPSPRSGRVASAPV
jgi:uroporphyrinogen-III synthase